MLISTRSVRRYAALTTSYVTGNGPGSENPIDCQGATKLVIFAFVEYVATATVHFEVEFYAGSDDPYLDVSGDDGATVTLSRTEYQLDSDQMSTSDQRIAIVVPVRGRFARVSAKYSTAGTPACAVNVATVRATGGEGQSFGLFRVREAASLTTTAPVTGDGPGSENAIPIARADYTTLFVDINQSTLNDTVELYMETSINGSEFYRETWLDPGSPAFDVYLKSYSIDESDWTKGLDNTLAIGIETLGAWAQFTFTALDSTTTNLAARALVGRV